MEAPAPLLPAELVLARLQRDSHLLATPGRRGLWRQVLVNRLGAKKLPCACIREAFFETRPSRSAKRETRPGAPSSGHRRGR
jgi:hypothetical protein